MNTPQQLTIEQFHAALATVLPELSIQQLEILQVLVHAPNHTINAGAIAKQMGIHHLTVNALFANVGERVLKAIVRASPHPVTTDFAKPWQVLARQGSSGLVKGFPWELRPEVVEFLQKPSLLENNFLTSDEPCDMPPLSEGSTSHALNIVRDRNALARAECLSAHGKACVACGLDMGQIYGPEFSNCVHVHHLNPLSQTDGPHTVDPIKDLVPVCPNCHSVIHAHGQLRTPQQVSDLLKKAHPK